MKKIYDRVAKWNSQRYDRQHNLPLTLSLLDEELSEYYEAKKQVDRLDAMCDVLYVALGAVWKLGVDDFLAEYSSKAATEVDNIVQATPYMPVRWMHSVIANLWHCASTPVPQDLFKIVNLAFTQMLYMGLEYDEVFEALNIVCDANDSKIIVRADPDKKANDGNKGPYFKDPEPRLQAIIDRVEERENAEDY